MSKRHEQETRARNTSKRNKKETWTRDMSKSMSKRHEQETWARDMSKRHEQKTWTRDMSKRYGPADMSKRHEQETWTRDMSKVYMSKRHEPETWARDMSKRYEQETWARRVLFTLFIAVDIPFSHRQHGSVPEPPPSHCMLCFVPPYCKHIKKLVYCLFSAKSLRRGFLRSPEIRKGIRYLVFGKLFSCSYEWENAQMLCILTLIAERKKTKPLQERNRNRLGIEV